MQERQDELKTSKGEIHSTDEVGLSTQAGWMCGQLLQKLADLNCKTRIVKHPNSGKEAFYENIKTRQ